MGSIGAPSKEQGILTKELEIFSLLSNLGYRNFPTAAQLSLLKMMEKEYASLYRDAYGCQPPLLPTRNRIAFIRNVKNTRRRRNKERLA